MGSSLNEADREQTTALCRSLPTRNSDRLLLILTRGVGYGLTPKAACV